MGEAEEQFTVYHRRTHVQRHLLLMPSLLDTPSTVARLRFQAVNASVFATQQHSPAVKYRRGHVLVGTDMREGELPQETARFDIHTNQCAVIPLDDLSHVMNLNHKWRRVGRAVVSLAPDLGSTLDIKSDELDFQILNPLEEGLQMEVILVAAKKELVDNKMALLADAGLSASVIDVDAFALHNAFERNYPEAMEGIVALVNVGHEVTNVNIL